MSYPRFLRVIGAPRTPERLAEVAMDVGRKPLARYFDGSSERFGKIITRDDLANVTSALPAFDAENRTGVELHRVSALRDRFGEAIGLTCRIGRPAPRGFLPDHVVSVLESGRSTLFVGKPGSGKTTALRYVGTRKFHSAPRSIMALLNQLQPNDEYYTPDYCMDYILPYVKKLKGRKKNFTVWEPACGAQRAIVTYLSRHGIDAIGTCLSKGPKYDFLTFAPAFSFDMILTNPPFTLKKQFIHKCLEHKKPFILLMPLRILENTSWYSLYLENDFSFLIPTKRIDYIKPDGTKSKSAFQDAARTLSESKHVVVVDAAGEIGGFDDVPLDLGDARRMHLPAGTLQFHGMLEAVQNHTPDVIIVDEISTADEASACQTIAERGVQLIASAHGHFLADIVHNNVLNVVVGGVVAVTVADQTAKSRGSDRKTVLERTTKPAFPTLVELRPQSMFVVRDTAEDVDALLRRM